MIKMVFGRGQGGKVETGTQSHGDHGSWFNCRLGIEAFY